MAVEPIKVAMLVIASLGVMGVEVELDVDGGIWHKCFCLGED